MQRHTSRISCIATPYRIARESEDPALHHHRHGCTCMHRHRNRRSCSGTVAACSSSTVCIGPETDDPAYNTIHIKHPAMQLHIASPMRPKILHCIVIDTEAPALHRHRDRRSCNKTVATSSSSTVNSKRSRWDPIPTALCSSNTSGRHIRHDASARMRRWGVSNATILPRRTPASGPRCQATPR